MPEVNGIPVPQPDLTRMRDTAMGVEATPPEVRVIFADLGQDVKQRSWLAGRRDYALEYQRLQEEAHTSRGFAKVKAYVGLAKHSFLRAGYERKHREEARQEIVREKDLFSSLLFQQENYRGLPQAALDQARQQHREKTGIELEQRAASATFEQQIQDLVGGDKVRLVSQDAAVSARYNNLQTLILNYTQQQIVSDVDRQNFSTQLAGEITAIQQELGHGTRTLIGANLNALIEQIEYHRELRARGTITSDLHLTMQYVTLGAALNGDIARNLNTAEKVIDWIQERGPGAVVGNAFAWGVAGAALDIAQKAGTGVVSGASRLYTLGLPVVGSVIAGFRAHGEVKKELLQNDLGRAMGIVSGTEGPARQRAERYKFQTENYADLLTNIRQTAGEFIADPADAAKREAFLQSLAKELALERVGRLNGVELISYMTKDASGNEQAVETPEIYARRRELTQAMAVARAMAKGQLAAADQATFENDLRTVLDNEVTRVYNTVYNPKASDRRNYALKEAGKKTVIALGTGVAVGGATKWAVGHIVEWAKGWQWFGSPFGKRELGVAGVLAGEASLGGPTQPVADYFGLKLPSGFNMHDLGPLPGGGKMELTIPDGRTVVLDYFNTPGKSGFTLDAVQKLRDLGFNAHEEQVPTLLSGIGERVNDQLKLALPHGYDLEDLGGGKVELTIPGRGSVTLEHFTDQTGGHFTPDSIDKLRDLGLDVTENPITKAKQVFDQFGGNETSLPGIKDEVLKVGQAEMKINVPAGFKVAQIGTDQLTVEGQDPSGATVAQTIHFTVQNDKIILDQNELGQLRQSLGLVTHEPPVTAVAKGLNDVLADSQELAKRNIIDATDIKKGWNFHVPWREFTDKTGLHAGNELRMHFWDNGNYYSQDHPTRFLAFGGHLTDKEIQSYITGLSAKVDPDLAKLVTDNPGLGKENMVLAVGLTSGKTLYLPMDKNSLVELPQELLDKDGKPSNAIKWFADVILEKNGKVVDGHEVLAGKAKIPDGVTMHSLASIQWNKGGIPALPTGVAQELTFGQLEKLMGEEQIPTIVAQLSAQETIAELTKVTSWEEPWILPLDWGRKPLEIEVPEEPEEEEGKKKFGKREYTHPAQHEVPEEIVHLAELIEEQKKQRKRQKEELEKTPEPILPPDTRSFVEQVGELLDKGANETRVQLRASPKAIAKYLESLTIPSKVGLLIVNSQLRELTITPVLQPGQESHLEVKGKIKYPIAGGIEFSAPFANDPQGGLAVAGPITLSTKDKRVRAKIEENIGKINSLVRDELNKQIDQKGWELVNFKIEGDHIIFDFRNMRLQIEESEEEQRQGTRRQGGRRQSVL